MTALAPAIPIAAPGPPGQVSIGTGFLARRPDGELRLMTAAHLPTNAQPFHTANWLGWPGSINVFRSVFEAIEVPLFFAGSITRTPLFRYLDTPLGKMADMIAFGGSTHTSTISALADRYDVFDLTPPATWSMSQGDLVTAFGYPTLPGTGVWPYEPPSSTDGTYMGLAEGPMFHLAMPTKKGFSGGPAFTTDGTFIGMHIGETDGHARVIPGHVLASL